MDLRRRRKPTNEPSETEKEDPKLFLFGGVLPNRLGSDLPPQEMHQKAVSVFPALRDAIDRGDMEAALSILGKWPPSVVNYPLETRKISSKVSWTHKIIKLMDVDEDLTKLALGYSAGAEKITDIAHVDYRIKNRAIRDTILRGDITLAGQIVDKFYPTLLHDPRYVSLVPYFLAYQQLIELTRERKPETAWWIAKHSLLPITKSHPWLNEEMDRLLDLMITFRYPSNPNVSNKELLGYSQRQKTADSVIGAILLVFYDQACVSPHFRKGTFLPMWLKGLEDQ